MIVSTLIDGLWQGCIIVALAALIVRRLSTHDASTRYAVWFTALIAAIAAPLLSRFSNMAFVTAALSSPHTASWTVTLVPAGRLAHDAAGLLAPFSGYIVALWAGGAIAGLLRLGMSLGRIAAIRRRATAYACDTPGVFVSGDVSIPIAIGVFSPAIVLPLELTQTLHSRDVDRIIAHERAHIDRRDIAANLFQRIAEALLFFNPWIHIIGNHLSLEREAACDDRAVRTTGTAQDYASCLASLARNVARPASPLATPSALGSRHALVQRIERIAEMTPHPMPFNYYAIGGTAMLFAILGLVFATISPVAALTSSGDDSATRAQSAGAATVAAACANPNADAKYTGGPPPELPHGLNATGSVIALLTIAPNGTVAHASISHSSGVAAIDRAVLTAAEHGTYAPKTIDCRAVQSDYLFRADFKPDKQ